VAANSVELNQLRYFVAVAEELNFRRAAARLNMTQPPLSRHISLLEHTLGTPLFDRTNRSVRLTAAGRRLLIDATDILTRAEAAVLAAQQAARGTLGAVEIGFIPSASIEVIPRIVRRVRMTMPEVVLHLREVMTIEAIEMLGAGSLDFAIIRQLPQGQSLPTERLWSEPFVLALPADHPLVRKPVIELADLNGLDFIGYSSERGGFLQYVVQGFLSARGISVNELYAVAQRHTVMSLVNEGIGAALVPRSSVTLRLPNVICRDIGLPEEELHSDLYLAMRTRPPEPLVAAVLDLVRDELGRDRGTAAGRR